MIKLHEVKEYLKKNYANLGKIRSVERLEHNDINSSNYLVCSEKGKYVLHNFMDCSKPTKIETLCKILDLCRRNEVKVTEPVKNRHEHYVDKKERIFITKYYAGKYYNGTEREIKDLAKNVAILHKTLAAVSIKYNYRPDISRYYKILTTKESQKIKQIIKNKKNRLRFDENVTSNMDYLIECCKRDEENSKITNRLDLKKQLIHCDLHTENVIFNNNMVATIIDFIDMRKGKKIEDIAFASFRFASYKTNNINAIIRKIRLFIDTYKFYNEIEEDELFYFKHFFIHEMLRRLSYILRKRYFHNSDIWSMEYDKIFNFLKLANKIKDPIMT